jgi:hypothetical protein
VIMMGFLAHFSIAATAGSGAWTVLNSGHEGDYLWSVRPPAPRPLRKPGRRERPVRV